MRFALQDHITCRAAVSNRLQLPIVQEGSLLESVDHTESRDRLPIQVPAPMEAACSPYYAKKIEELALSIAQSLEPQFPPEQRSSNVAGTLGSIPPQVFGNGPLSGQKFPRKNSKVRQAIKFLIRLFLF